MHDITVVYYTANQINEDFAQRVREHLKESAEGIRIISVSQKPIALGENHCVGEIGMSVPNLYRQVLVGASLAETEYIACCEDDSLYHPSHFTAFRPKDTFAYNINRWSLFTWCVPPLFSFKVRAVFSQLIAPREALIKTLMERIAIPFEGWRRRHLGEPGRYEKLLGLTEFDHVRFESPQPNIVITHIDGFQGQGLGRRKRMAQPTASAIEPWGSAEDMLQKFIGQEELERQRYGDSKSTSPCADVSVSA